MKFRLLLVSLLTGWGSVQANQLTFRVDMGTTAVPAGGVHVAGNFQAAAGFPADWNPATTALADPDGDHVWEATVSVPAGGVVVLVVEAAGSGVSCWQAPRLRPSSNSPSMRVVIGKAVKE